MKSFEMINFEKKSTQEAEFISPQMTALSQLSDLNGNRSEINISRIFISICFTNPCSDF